MSPLRSVRILVALDLTHQSGREHLAGFYRFADTRRDWEVRLMPNTDDASHPAITEALRQGVEGVVMKGECVSALAATLQQAGVPVVSIDRPGRGENDFANVYICNDNQEIGRKALRHFDSLGRYAAYGFVPDPNDCEWSRARGAAFLGEASKRHSDAVITTATSELGDWLTNLPKPAAVFAAFDHCAATLLETCRERAIKIPNDVAILGVDNDALICEHTRPKLSSIRPDHEGQGFFAARELDRQLTKRVKKPHIVVCPPLGVIVRDTTEIVPPATHLVREINAFLDEHALEPIRVTDVVRHVNVSARLANLRYTQTMGHAIQQELLARRLKAVQQQLIKTGYPINRIATQCGFKSAIVLTHLFHKRFGQSPRAWRKDKRSRGI